MRKGVKYICLAGMLAGITMGVMAEAIPSGYYDGVQGLKDSVLKSALHDSICKGVRVSYGTQGYTYPDNVYYPATWNFFPQTDRRADGTIWDMYSNSRRYFTHDGGSACGLEIEHCFPKSWWGWTTQSSGKTDSVGYRAYRDLYHLNPADAQANNNKSNFPPGHVKKGDKLDNGSFRMDSQSASEYGWACFEPAPEYRGDFARAYFYIATAYENLTWASKYSDYLDNKSYLEFQPWLVEVLLDWHRSDPVSMKEVERADAVSNIQHNRNPYIDYPELVEYIWGNRQGQEVDFERLICTISPDYMPIPDFCNFKAYQAEDVSRGGFTATWSNLQTEYVIDVYTRTYTGKNDTLINLPALSAKILANNPYTSAQNCNNSKAGQNALTMGRSNNDGSITIEGLTLTQEAQLVFRASAYPFADAGELQISFDDCQAEQSIFLPTANKTRDEDYYHLIVPAGTETIQILSVGGSTKKRACMQELYLIQGDRQEHTESVEGYPQIVDAAWEPTRYCREQVTLPINAGTDTIYYCIETENGQRSNEVQVVLPTETDIETAKDAPYPTPRKILQDGRIYILHNGRYYGVMGEEINL